MSGEKSGDELTPRSLSKQEFAARLYNLMVSRGWNQSELSRQAGVARDNVSRYIRAVSLPTPQALEGLARAFNLSPAELLPNVAISAIDEDQPAFEMKSSVNSPGVVMLRINRLVSMSSAVKIAEIIQNDKAANGE